MATLIDSYTGGALTTNFYGSSIIRGVGQSFTNINSITLDSCSFQLKKVGDPTGSISAKIFAHSGTYGTSSVATGSALATSDNIDLSTLTGTFQYISFTFSGTNRISLIESTYYVVFVDYTGGDSSNYLQAGRSAVSGHDGNYISWNGTIYSANSSRDVNFYVYGETATQELILACEQGSYSIDGQDITITKTLQISTSIGYYTLLGRDVTLTYQTGAVEYTLTCNTGSYSLTGQDIAFLKALGVSLSQGSYTISGQNIAFLKALNAILEQGSYSLTGEDTELIWTPNATAYSLDVENGSYTLTGEDIDFIKSLTADLDFGSYILSGQEAHLKSSRDYLHRHSKLNIPWIRR